MVLFLSILFDLGKYTEVHEIVNKIASHLTLLT